MYSFEGDFRSKPRQSLGGASKKLARDELLQKVAEERRNRENTRRKMMAVITIQAFFRGTLTRISEKNKFRKKFDENRVLIEKMKIIDNPDILKLLLQQLIFFYSAKCDSQRLNWLSQLYLKQNHLVAGLVALEPSDTLHRIQSLLQINLNSLVSAVEQVPIAVPLRLLEVFTDHNTYLNMSTQATEVYLQSIWRNLIRNGYYRHLKLVLEQRVPDSLRPSSSPPTPLAQSLYNLIIRPFSVGGSQMFRVAMIRALLSDIFSEPLPPQISNFILLALSEQNDFLPLADLLAALIDQNEPYPRPNSCQLAIQPTIWLLYSFLTLTSQKLGYLKGDIVVDYLQVLQCLAPKVQVIKDEAYAAEKLDGNQDDDDEDPYTNKMETEDVSQSTVDKSLSFLNKNQLVNALCQAVEDSSLNEQCLASICSVCYTLLINQRLAIHRFRLLYTLAFKSKFLRLLWKSILQATTVSVLSAPVPLVHLLSKGIALSPGDREFFLPQLIVFCSLFAHLLPTLHDDEFYKDESGNPWKANHDTMPFTLEELSHISLTLRNICLGWIELAYPDTRPSLNADYKHAMKNACQTREGGQAEHLPDSEVGMWLRLFKEATDLLSQLYGRDSRRQFCPESHWIAHHIVMPVEKPCDLPLGSSRLNSYKPFMGLRNITREQLEEEGPPISITIVRYLKILQELPFVVSFPTRVKIFQALVYKDKQENQGEMYNFMMGPLIQVLIRRNYIYEDAFDKLSLENEQNLKLRMKVQLVNVVGLDEAGIDGGGIFREFLSELLKTAFDPNRGFFKTTLDRLLYPNPGVTLLVDNYPKHYYFIGRMLGKAIYENMLVELPFAAFFLAKMLGRHTGDVDILHLASLDTVMYKNLLYLKTYEGDVSDLGLDFTVMNSELGENKLVELKFDGISTPVTVSNRIEYIHLVADYKLNKQIKAQCLAFKQGLANVIDLEWLRMFDPKELQVLISGAHIPVDVTDLKMHTNYAGGYTADHKVIKAFWKVVESFTEQQRRQLLKFVTSCSRPPLLGFKELAPAFCIQNAGSEPERLPTASTCMNLLKLPEFQDEKTLRSKLLYAIESGAGFELS